ncbi:MAG: hypothetical protein C4519_27615, partial [Desulfobacteraceae bacterium]
MDSNIINWTNSYPVKLPANRVAPFANTTTFNNLSPSSALVVTDSSLTADSTWPATIAYLLTNSLTVQGTSGGDGITTLTLQPGVQLRFDQGQYLYVGDSSGSPGALVAQGTEAAPIVFTANSSSPTPGYWVGIYFRNTASDALSRIEYSVIEYGGYNGYGNIYLYDAAPTVRYNLIRNSSNNGIRINGSGSNGAIIECNNIKDNPTGIYLSGSTARIGDCNFINNRNYGLYNAGSSQVNAANNWWGHADGPNAGGDSVYGNVITSPWRTEPSGCVSNVDLNDPPLAAKNPQPADGATNIAFPNSAVTIRWTGGDPNPSDTVVYDIQWGTDGSTLSTIAENLTAASYSVGGLQASTTYFWRVVTRDSRGLATAGPVWRFTTAAPQPDLEIGGLTWTPSSAIAGGQQVTFTATLLNSGPGMLVPSVRVDFRVNGQSIGSQEVSTDLAQGQTEQVTRTWTAQIGPASITVVADSTSAVAENDESNNSRAADLGTIADITPPEMTGTAPTDNASVRIVNRIDIFLIDRFGGSIDNDATLSNLTVSAGGQPVSGTRAVAGDRFSFTPATAPLPENVYQVSLVASDMAGNHRSYGFNFIVDEQAPLPPVITGGGVTSGTIQARPAQNRSNKATITLTGTREDNTSIRINTTNYSNLGSGPWSIERSLSQGDNALEIRSRDAAGNVSEPVFVDIFVDSVKPVIGAVTPADQSFLNAPPAALSIDYTETGSGLDPAATAFTVQDGNLNPVSGTWNDTAGRILFTPVAAWGNDAFTLSVRLVDKLGNASPVKQSVFTVDTVVPPRPLIDPVTTPTHTVTQLIRGQKEAFAAIVLNGQEIIAHSAGNTWQHSVSLTSGENLFSFAARDRAGNMSETAQTAIVLDDIAPPPVGTLTANGNGAGTSVLLNWSGYNEALHGDIQSYRIFCESAPFTDTSVLAPKSTVPNGAYTHVVQNLISGSPYWFAVVAVDRMGNFNPSVTPVPATPTDTLPPGEVTGLSVQSFADRLLFTWQAPTSQPNDLDGYKVYFNGAATPETLAAQATSFERSGLAAASAYAFRITTCDAQNNESSGRTLSAYTWLSNPAGLAAEPYNGYVQLGWNAVAPAANLKHYAVYVSPGGPFTTIAGMAPAITATSTLAKVAGLTNHQTYYFAVTAVNRSNGERPDVTTVPAQPTPDETGPQISAVQIDGQPLTSGHTISRSAAITLAAADPSGVSRIEFKLDGAPLFIDYKSPYRWDLDILRVADGAHALEISAYDSLNNSAMVSYALNISMALPPAPVITQPADEWLTNQASIMVQGQAEKESTVIVYLEGQAVGSPVPVDAQGRFSAVLTLNEGTNRICAAARNRAGTGPMSPEKTVTLDTSRPSAPVNPAAQAIESGVVRLTWSPPAGKLVSAYNVYRSNAPFSTTVAGIKVNNAPLNATGYRDLPPSDGTWYYRMTSLDAAQNESDPSVQVSATADSIAPRITAIHYAPQGRIDAVSGAVAPGRVNISMTVSETLMAPPFLSITPEKGLPITIALIQTGETSFSGYFTIEQFTPSGTAYAVFSGRDRVGNRGTEIDSGLSLLIDTAGPAVRRIVLNPASPIRNDAQNPAAITVTIGLNEAVAAGTAPVLDYRLSGPGRGAVNIPVLAQIAPVFGDVQTWQAVFDLPSDAGELQVETLQFVFAAEDHLGNRSDRVLAPNHFQVYQGDLPPLEAPMGLTAKGLSGGRVELKWNSVTEAIGYQIYRQAPTESERTLLTRMDGAGTFYLDATPMDGTYYYAVSSLRSENGQEAESSPSNPVSVRADATPPLAPQNLALQLISAGIDAQWQAVAGDDVTYRLYRSDAMQITSVEGLTPVDAQFSHNRALDRRPSPTDHTYVVTAVDQAGNESAPSNSVYLNFALLPAATIAVEQIDNQKPVLSWTHPGGSLAGFDVYMGPLGQSVKINTDLIGDMQMADNGYAGDSREYRVIAVDPNAVESPARILVLPAIQIERADDKVLRRGIMNKLEYKVSNLTGQSVGDLKVIVRLRGIDHPSAGFSLAGNQSLVIPVIVAGYGELQDIEPVTATVQMTPNTGESARIVRTGEIQVGEGMLALQIYTEEFIRGGTGKVRFALENSGEADIEIVTARNSGSQASDEVRFSLLDLDGNTLSSLAFKQAAGTKIVSLSGGKTVARIPAGAVFQSDQMQIPVPATAPEELNVRLSVANIYHHYSRDDQLTMRGISSNRSVNLVETEYTGTIASISPPVTAGPQDVRISGKAVLRGSDQPVPNAALNLIITLNGFERKIALTTNADGGFDYTFKALEGETGTYTVAALHPALLDRPVQATFTVTKVAIRPANIRLNMPKNYQQTIPIEVTTGVDTQVHNLRLVYENWDQPANAFARGVTYSLGNAIEVLGAEEKGVIHITISSDSSAADSGSLVFRLISDETGVNPWGHVRIDARLNEAQPFLAHSPHFVETGVQLGQMVTETITLENKGLADLEGVTVSLIGENYQPVPDWVVLNAAGQMGTLAPGAKQPVSISFAPRTNTPEGFYTFYLRVQANDYPVSDIGLYVSATPSGIGNALFKVKNIYTGTLNARNEVIQGLSGARITLQNEKNLTIVHEKTTDNLGEALFSNLPAGIYKYRVKAAGHQERISRLWIKPGLTVSEDMFLEYNFVTVEWEVVETTIQDKYEIVLNITYETNVPAPVVVCEPSSVSLPDLKAGDVFNGELALTNKGLIRADNVELKLPKADQYVRYELLAPVPQSLGAKERITIPYRLTCLQSLSAAEEVQSGGGSGCYRACFTTTYHGVSSNGCPYSGSVPHCFSRPCGGTSSGSGSGSGNVGGSWVNWGAGGTGSSGTSSVGWRPPPTAIGDSTEPCTPPPEQEGGNSRCGDGQDNGQCKKDSEQQACQSVGSWANIFYRAYTDDVVDLSLKVPGGSIDIRRAFFNHGARDFYRDMWRWEFGAVHESGIHGRTIHFQFASYDPSRNGNILPIGSIIKDGIEYLPGENKTSIDLSSGETAVLRPRKGPAHFSYRGENIWRWEGKGGNWKDYYNADGDGRLIASGNHNDVDANLLFQQNSSGHSELIGMADRNGRQVIWFEYGPEEIEYIGSGAENECTKIVRKHMVVRDVIGRQISYDISIHRPPTRIHYPPRVRLEGQDSSPPPQPCPSQPQVLVNRFVDVNGGETFYEYGPIPNFPAFVECIVPPRLGLKKIVDPAGRQTILKYHSNGELTSVLDQEGNGYSYKYGSDAGGRQTYSQTTDTNGMVKEVWFDYSGEANRVAINGRTVQIIEKDGRTYTITDEAGNKTMKVYDQWDNLVRVVYPDGAEVKYEYDPALQKVLKKLDENSVATRYYYDESGHVIRRVEAVGTDLQRTTEFGYDTEGNLTSIRRSGDSNTAEALTSMTYDEYANMTGITDPEGHTTSFTYDVMGNVLTRTDPRGKTWTYTYDAAGRLRTVTNPLNHISEYFYDPVGNKIREIDPAGKETVYEYDARDNLKKRINPVLEETLIENTFDGRVMSQTDAENKKNRYEYDADGRLAKNIDGNGNIIAMDYSGDGGGCSACGSGKGTGDQPAAIEFPTFTREIKYDSRGRKYAERDLLDDSTEHLTRYMYDSAGNLTAKTDAQGRTTTYAYDLLNRLSQVIDADGRWTAYTYDKRDNLIALTDAEDHTTRFEYDRNNRLVKEIRPMGEETSYGYDGAGNLIEKIDAKNQRSEYLYDDAGRLSGIR